MIPICNFIYTYKVTVAIITILIGIKLYIKLTTGMCKSTRKMTGKTVIITGANTGIGKETAMDLAGRGARVIMACRDLERAEEARSQIISETGNKNVVVEKLDLSLFSSVREFAQKILTTEPRLDVLINNAGAAGLGEKKTKDGLHMVMQINHFGHFLLTILLLELMKKSSPSRIIFVSSQAHLVARFDLDNLNFEKWFSDAQTYFCSKLANILTANELARKLEGTGVTVNSLHPGAVKTEVFRHMPEFGRKIVLFLIRLFFKTANEGAQTTIHLAVSEEVEGVTGKYFMDCKVSSTSKLAQDEGVAKKLWEKSEQLVGL